MLRSAKQLQGYAIQATDDRLGSVSNFYFDDTAWVIRYLVVDTDGRLARRKVLISPIAIHTPLTEEEVLSVSITKAQVQDSPDIDTDMPISRQHEVAYFGHYGLLHYWNGLSSGGENTPPGMITSSEHQANAAPAAQREHDDPHLRSSNEVIRYHVRAKDGEIGRVSDLLIDDKTWAIRYLIVDTGNWWSGYKVLIAPEWIDDVSWDDSTVTVDLTRQAVKDAPIFTELSELNRQREIGIYAHYGLTGYWAARERERNETESA